MCTSVRVPLMHPGSHGVAIKRIARYLQGVLQNGDGLCFDSTGDLKLDSHVDADFDGLWGHGDDQDPVCV